MLSGVDKNFHYPFQEPATDSVKPGPLKRLYNIINAVKELEIEPKQEEEPQKKSPEGEMFFLNCITLCQLCIRNSFGIECDLWPLPFVIVSHCFSIL